MSVSLCLSLSESHFQHHKAKYHVSVPGKQTWYHGTTGHAGSNILQYGIQLEAGRKYQDFSNGNSFYLTNNLQSSIDWSKQISKAVATATRDAAATVKAAAGIHNQSEIDRIVERADIASKDPSSIDWSKKISKAVATASRDASATVKAAAGIHDQIEIERIEERADIASKSPSAVLIYRIPVEELESLRIFESLNEERREDWQQVVRYYR